MVLRVAMDSTEGLLALARHIGQYQLLLAAVKFTGRHGRILRIIATNNQLYGLLEKPMCP